MKIEEAIKIKETQFNDPWLAPKGKLAEADKLGIEALKYRLKLEQENGDITLEPLPGETED